MAVLSFPFRVNPLTNGVAALADGSDQEITEAVAAHVMVQPRERPMRPDFGTESLPFGLGLSQGALQLQLREYGWAHVSVTHIEPGPAQADGYRRYSVTWDRSA